MPDVNMTAPSGAYAGNNDAPLAAWPNYKGADVGATNPLDTVGAFATIQNQLNQARQFRAEFAAKQKLGQYIAGAPDAETGVAKAMLDPSIAGFIPDAVKTWQDTLYTMQNTAGLKATQANSALEAVIQATAGSMNDPSTFGAAVDSRMAVLPKSIRDSAMNGVKNYVTAMTQGLPQDPVQAKKVFQQRVAAWAIPAGVTPDSIKGILGTPSQINAGGTTYTGVTAPPQGTATTAGGAFTPQTAVGMTLPAQLYGLPGGVTQQAGGGAPGVHQLTNDQGNANPLLAPLPSATGAPSGTTAPRLQSNIAPAEPPPTGGNSVSASAVSSAGDGTALIPPNYKPEVPVVGGKGLGGLNVQSQTQLDHAKALQNEFDTNGLSEFHSAQRTAASLDYMDNAYDQMIKGGGFLAPGTAAAARLDLAKGVNTLAQIAGLAPPFDTTKVAAGEDIMKETKRMGLTVLTQLLGNQREAAQTIQSITTSVPGIENTYMGGKLVIDSIRAVAQRAQDQYNFENWWINRPETQGNLSGADAEFNRLHPADSYAKAVMDKHGISSKGFTSMDAVRSALQEGYITLDQANTIKNTQFKYDPKTKTWARTGG